MGFRFSVPSRPISTAAFLVLLTAPALAGPTYTFSVSEGVQPSNVGTITLTQVNTTTVDVLVDLIDTALPLPEYGFVNSGGPHTPFAFTLAGTESGVTATFIQPPSGIYTFGIFSLSTNNGSDTPYGTFGISIDSTADNGTSNAYFGDLQFDVTRPSGLSTDDFILNTALDTGSSGPAYFAADLTDGSNTGTQAWKLRDSTIITTVNSVPEPSSLALLGAGLMAIGLVRRRRVDSRSADCEWAFGPPIGFDADYEENSPSRLRQDGRAGTARSTVRPAPFAPVPGVSCFPWLYAIRPEHLEGLRRYAA